MAPLVMLLPMEGMGIGRAIEVRKLPAPTSSSASGTTSRIVWTSSDRS